MIVILSFSLLLLIIRSLSRNHKELQSIYLWKKDMNRIYFWKQSQYIMLTKLKFLYQNESTYNANSMSKFEWS